MRILYKKYCNGRNCKSCFNFILLIFLLIIILSPNILNAQQIDSIENKRVDNLNALESVSKDTISHCQKMRDSLALYYSWDIAFQKMPEIIGGYDSLLLKLQYPEEAVKNKIEGKVYISILVDTSGHPMCPMILGKRLGYGCDEEAVRLVMKTKFTPAISHNRKRIVQMVVPISFKLKKDTD